MIWNKLNEVCDLSHGRPSSQRRAARTESPVSVPVLQTRVTGSHQTVQVIQTAIGGDLA